MAYFWKDDCSRISKIIFPGAEYTNTKIQKYKFTNTQIQHMTKCQKDPTCGIFLKRGLLKDVKKYIPMCRTHKYKNTNSQIHKYTNTQIQHMGKNLKKLKTRKIKKMWYLCQIRSNLKLIASHIVKFDFRIILFSSFFQFQNCFKRKKYFCIFA